MIDRVALVAVIFLLETASWGDPRLRRMGYATVCIFPPQHLGDADYPYIFHHPSACEPSAEHSISLDKQEATFEDELKSAKSYENVASLHQYLMILP